MGVMQMRLMQMMGLMIMEMMEMMGMALVCVQMGVVG